MAVYDLGLPPDVFWDMTPVQLAAVVARKDDDDLCIDVRFGMVVATIINCFNAFGKESKKPVSPLGVMGYEEDEDSQASVNRSQSPQEIALRMRLANAAAKNKIASKGQ